MHCNTCDQRMMSHVTDQSGTFSCISKQRQMEMIDVLVFTISEGIDRNLITAWINISV